MIFIKSINIIWKDIKGYKGLYQINNIGQVKSLSRVVTNGNGSYITKERILKPMRNYKGYLGVELQEKYHFIHRLVAKVFIPNIENKPQVNHIDGNKQNNTVTNLEWVTNRENQLHAYAHGLQNHSKRAGRKRLKVYQIDLTTNKKIKLYNCLNDATKETKIPQTNISQVCKGKRHSAGGYKWEFYRNKQ